MFHDLNFTQPTEKRLSRKFANTPGDKDGICLEDTDLSFTDGIAYINTFKHIPPHVVKLKLLRTNLAALPIEKLNELLEAIPLHVHTLHLCDNHLCLFEDDLKYLGIRLPAHITTLGLEGNSLSEMSTPHLINFLTNLPATVTSLDLTQNRLRAKSTEDLRAILMSIPHTVTTLTYSMSHSERINGDFCLVIRDLADSIPHLNWVSERPIRPTSYEKLSDLNRFEVINNLLNLLQQSEHAGIREEVSEKTLALIDDPTTIDDYIACAKTMSGKPSFILQGIGYLMMAVAATLALTVLAAVIMPALNLGIVGVVASTLELGGCSAGAALIGFGLFALNAPSGVYQAMVEVAEAVEVQAIRLAN